MFKKDNSFDFSPTLTDEQQAALEQLLEALDDHDDVQDIVTNVIL